MAGARRPEELNVWRLGWELKRMVYAFTATLPASRDLRYCQDIRSAARSAPDLVAEGFYRFNPREFHRFLNDARASLGEVRNQLLHAKDEKYVSDQEFRDMFHLADRAIGAATKFQAYLRTCGSKVEPRPRPRRKLTTSELQNSPERETPETEHPTAANPEPSTRNQNSAPQNPKPRTTTHRF